MRCKHSGQTTTLFGSLRVPGSEHCQIVCSTVNPASAHQPTDVLLKRRGVGRSHLEPGEPTNFAEQIRCVHYFRSWDQ